MLPWRAHTGRVHGLLCLALLAAVSLGTLEAGCQPAIQQGTGPGHRRQILALDPDQELALGRKAYRYILDHADVLPDESPDAERVRRVGLRIAHACEIEPLMREINLNLKGYRFEWEFHALEEDRINAFCLPGGKVAVFTGLLNVAENDDQLATVIGHEVAHALAHHANERVALQGASNEAFAAVQQGFDGIEPDRRHRLIGLLSAGAVLHGLAYDRFQELEADHIGVFLMTFAGYDPQEAVAFWESMRQLSAERGHLPEILSDHPSDARRIAQIKGWVPLALGAKQAYDEGRILPATGR